MAAISTENTKHGFFEFKKYSEYQWFRFLIYLLISISLIYLISHYRKFKVVDESAAYEYEKLGKEQLLQINRIYFDTLVISAQNIDNPSDDADTNANENIEVNQKPFKPVRIIKNTKNVLFDTSECARAIAYLQNEFSNKVDSFQIEQIRPYLCSSTRMEAIGFLSNIRLRVRSYFWLVGPEVYFEIIFWAWFGVIASLVFNLGVVGRNITTNPENPQSVFDSSEIPYQFAKLLYAPLCTLVIVLGYNFFTDQNIVDIGSSKGVIVFAFIGGFYSARLISFLDRLKDLLLPHSGTADHPVQTPTATVLLSNIIIDLQLDDATIFPELRNDIAELGLAEAVVNLENSENGEIIKAVKSGEDQSSVFNVSSIKPGTYAIKVTWSKEINLQPVNLIAEQKEVIRLSDTTINVILKKDNSEG